MRDARQPTLGRSWPYGFMRRWRALARLDSWHGNALLVRKDVEIICKELVHLPSLEPRGAVLADLVVKGLRLRAVGMHLDLSGLWRRQQAHAILAHVDGRDSIANE